MKPVTMSYNFLNVYQKVHNFCSLDLGGFYLDIIKDRQYTTQSDSLARRSCQTAMYHIMEAFVRWIAPILSFTAEELWKELPGKRGDTVHTQEWYTGLVALGEQKLSREFWEQIMTVKTAVNKTMEDARNNGLIRGSLQAEVDLYASPELYAELEKLGDELRFVLITSRADLAPLESAPADAVETDVEGLKVAVAKSEHEKCERCWHHREDVGSNEKYTDLCGRCIDNVEGEGEVRHYA